MTPTISYLLPMTNRYYLTTGFSFPINPNLEPHPSQAKFQKLDLLATLPDSEFSQPYWDTKAIRAFATGICPISTQKGRLPKATLLSNLAQARKDYLDNLAAKASQTATFMAQRSALDKEAVLDIIQSYTGLDMVTNLRLHIDSYPGWSESYKAKDISTLIVKLITAHYQGPDKAEVIKGWKAQFRAKRDQMNALYRSSVWGRSGAISRLKPVNLATLKPLLEPNEARWIEVTIAVALATGRRMSEVLGIKTRLTEPDGYSLLFEGQLKTKGRGDVPPFRIPTLIPAVEVIRLWKLLEPKLADPETVDARYGKRFSTLLPKHLRAIWSEAGIRTFKDLRDVWIMAHLPVCPPDISEQVFMSRLLGHTPKDLNTGNSYRKYQLSAPEDLALFPSLQQPPEAILLSLGWNLL